MSIQNPALFLDGESHPAEDVRRWVHALAGGVSGIVASGDFLVSQNGTPNMSVDVAAGRAYVAGSESGFQGVYFVENRASVNLAISAADATNPRIDLVVLKLEDSTYSGAIDAASLVVVTGTAAASPSEPSAPANSLVLARVDVDANETTILTADLTDRRGNLATTLGGVRPVTSSTRPGSPRPGEPIFEQDTGNLSIWSGSAWSPLAYSSDVADAVPAGVAAMYVLPGSVPSGWLELNGQTVVGADILYPDLWAIAPAGWKSGSNLTVPNLQGKFPAGASASDTDFDLEDVGGSKTQTLTTTHLPAHTHDFTHTHNISASSAGAHTHGDGSLAVSSSGGHTHDYPFNTNPPIVYKAGAGFGESIGTGVNDGSLEFIDDGDVFNYNNMSTSGSHSHTVTGTTASSGAHTHTGSTTSQSTSTTGSAGSGGAFSILPPYFTVRFILKA